MSIKNYSILVAIDGSESSMKAVDYAIELAKKEDNSRLTVLNILDMNTAKQVSSSIITAPTYGLEEYELHKKAVLEWLDAIKSKCENEGIQTEIKVIGGPSPVPDSIIIYAENENVDLIVVGTKGRSGFKKLLLGSVASKVVTYAHCPVLVVK
jgi:nucleotide-binding universal stress UspA family protein